MNLHLLESEKTHTVPWFVLLFLWDLVWASCVAIPWPGAIAPARTTRSWSRACCSGEPTRTSPGETPRDGAEVPGNQGKTGPGENQGKTREKWWKPWERMNFCPESCDFGWFWWGYHHKWDDGLGISGPKMGKIRKYTRISHHDWKNNWDVRGRLVKETMNNDL